MKKKPSKKNERYWGHKGDIVVEMGPPQIEPIKGVLTEDDLINASRRLIPGMEAANQTIGRQFFPSQNNTFRNEQERERTEAIWKAQDENVRGETLRLVSELVTCLNRFAKVSDLFLIDVEFREPEKHAENSKTRRIIGTSAHHAGVLFLQRCLSCNPFGQAIKHEKIILDWEMFRARIQWERMRAFDGTVGKSEDYQEATNDLYSHSPSYATVTWNGERYSFNGDLQRECVRVMWELLDSGNPTETDRTIIAMTDIDTKMTKLSDVFGTDHPAWKTMIVEGDAGRGTRKLNKI